MAGIQGADQAQAGPAMMGAQGQDSSQAQPTPQNQSASGDFTKLMERVAAVRKDLMQLAEDYPDLQGGVKGAIEALVQGLNKAGRSQKESPKGVRY